jgi:hypothetical protein
MLPRPQLQDSSKPQSHRGLIASFKERRRRRANRKRKAANFDPNILHLIFLHLEFIDTYERGCSHTNLLSTLLVCRSWSNTARQVLYRRVWACSLPRSECLLRTLTTDRNLSRSVRYIEVGPIWRGTDNMKRTYFSFSAITPDTPDVGHLMTTVIDSADLKTYIENMASCASLCEELLDARLAADKMIIQEPDRGPRVDHFLDLSHTHIFLRRLLLDDGGIHATKVSDIFPLTVKLPHLEELTLKNYAFVNPPRGQLFSGLGWLEHTELADPLPRLKSLRFVFCTSENAALAPLIRAVAATLKRVTVIQMPYNFAVSPHGDNTRWHFSDHAETDLFAKIGLKISQYSLETKFYRSSHCLNRITISYLRLTADQFQKGSFVDLPRTLRYIGLQITSTKDFQWDCGLAGGGQVDIFDLLEDLLLGGIHLPLLEYLSLRVLPRARKEVKLWVKTWVIRRLCRERRRKVEMGVFLQAMKDAWGSPLPPEGRRMGRLEIPRHTTRDTIPTQHRAPRRMVSRLKLGR